MICVGVLAETLQVLGAIDGDIAEHLALALLLPAMDLLRLHIIEIVVFEPVTAEAGRAGSNRLAILPI